MWLVLALYLGCGCPLIYSTIRRIAILTFPLCILKSLVYTSSTSFQTGFVSREAILWKAPTGQYYVKNPGDAIPREISRNFPRNWTTASLLAGYTANYTARCQSFSLPRSSGDIRGSWRPKRSLLDAASSRHKASLCAGILSSCRLSHGKPVS